jgi:hypothetical protein
MKVRRSGSFFEAERDGNSIHLFSPGGLAAAYLPLRTPARENGLCLSDYILDPAAAAATISPLRGDRGRGHPRAFRESQRDAASF